MKRLCFLIVLLFISPLGIFSQQTNIISGDLIVMLHSNEEADQLISSMKKVSGIKTNIKLKRILSSSMHIMLFGFDSNSIEENKMLSSINSNSLVLLAQFNHTFQERAVPNDTQFGAMWDMNNTGQNGGIPHADIDASAAWDITTGGLTAQGDTIVVAVIDDGFDLTHQDLNFWKNYQEIPGNGIDDDRNGYIDDVKGWNSETSNDAISVQSHGTHVSGTIGAKGNNGIGVTGVNWNVKVMAISYGSGNNLESDAVGGYAYARDQRKLYNQTNGAKGAFIVSTNSSFGVDLGQPSAYPIWCAMFDSLGQVGILSACATANQNYNIDLQGDIPTACSSDWMIAVTNTTNTDDKNPSCGFGATTIDLGAPGTNITSTYPSNTYQSISGTSMATPHVAGAVALMYSVQCNKFITDYKSNPSAMALMVKDSLLGAVDLIASMGSGITATGGRLNLYKSVKAIQNYCTNRTNINEIGELNTAFEIKSVYPNPATNQVTIVYNSAEPVEIIITDIVGQEIKRITEDNDRQGVHYSSIDVSSLAKGFYFVSICNKTINSNTIKVIID